MWQGDRDQWLAHGMPFVLMQARQVHTTHKEYILLREQGQQLAHRYLEAVFNTVQPLFSNHPRNQANVVINEGWLLKRGLFTSVFLNLVSM